MRKWLAIFAALMVAVGGYAHAAAPSIAMGTAGIVYTPDDLGNVITDFSYAGYGGGGVAIPTVPNKVSLRPVPGDNTTRIQAAINQVAALPKDARGIRGAVLLAAGTYQLDGSLTISSDGVVLRGAGPATILRFVGANRTGMTLSGSGGSSGTGTTYTITSTYVPLGSPTFTVNTTGLVVGDTVIVRRPWTQVWIDAMQMNATFLGTEAWSPKTGPAFERTITAVSGTQITVDIPLPTPIEQVWCIGTVQKYTDTGRIQNSGIESLTLLDAFDANTGPTGLSLGNCKNCWAKNVTVDTFGNGITSGGGSKWVTIQDCIFQNGFNNGSARPACFTTTGQMILFQRCTAISGFEHIVVTQDSTAGPNVFLYIKAINSSSFDGGPHQKWALGVLMDNFSGPISALKIYNAGMEGTGHGWVAGYSIEYNCSPNSLTCQQPPVDHHYNWIIGGTGTINSVSNPGTYQNFGTMVAPRSLYLQQLAERLGTQALANIGFARFSGNYRLIARHDLSAVTSAAGGNAVVQNSTGGNAWQFVDLGAGLYEIKNNTTGKALTVLGGGASEPIIQADYTGSPLAQWKIQDLLGGWSQFINKSTGKSLQVPGGSSADGVQLDDAVYTGANYQQFRVVSVP